MSRHAEFTTFSSEACAGLRRHMVDPAATMGELKTAAGEVRWRKPVAYQESPSGRKLVNANYRVDGNRISFQLGSYDHTESLVIDPAMVYGTFLDGSDFDYYHSFLVDSAGFAYIVGTTSSADFPVTPGAYQNYHTKNYEGFVSKLSQDGSYLVWSTMIAGTGPNTATPPPSPRWWGRWPARSGPQ